MKKILMTLAAVLCCAMTTTVFTACSSDDDSSKNDAEASTPVTGVMMCYFEPSEDELTLFDVTVEYTDASGKQQTETITGAWKKTITYTTLPVNVSMVVKQSLKPNVEMTKDSYKLGGQVSCLLHALKSDGESAHIYGSVIPNSVFNLTYPKGKVETYATKHATLVNYAYTISNKANSEGAYIW